MNKKTKDAISQNGTGNLAFLKSKDITVNQIQAFDQLNKLISQGDHNAAIELVSQMKEFVENQHPAAPHYKYEFSKDTQGNNVLSHVPAYPEAAYLHPLKGKFSYVFPERYKGFKNMNELLNYSYGKQQSIELDVVSLKTWVDETIIDEHHKDEFSSMKLTLIPKEFPAPTPMKLYLKDNSWAIDYLEMGVTEIDGPNVKIDNNKQENCPFYVSFKINIEKSGADFSINIKDEFENNVEDLLLFKEFIQISTDKDKSSIALKMLKENDDLMIANEWGFNEDISNESEDFISFLKMLKHIEDSLSIKFNLPRTGVTQGDMRIVELACASIENNCVKYELDDVFKVKISDAQQIEEILTLNEEKPNGFTLNLYNKMSTPIMLFGTPLDFSVFAQGLEEVKLEDAEKLRKKLKVKDDDEELNVNLVPIGKDSYLYEMLMDELPDENV